MPNITIQGRPFNMDACCTCGTEIFLPAALYCRLKVAGPKGTFYCVNGHPQCYRVSDLEKMRRERDRLKQDAAYKDSRIAEERAARAAAERSVSAYKGVVTRTKKRVGNGVCPCCNRTFKDLARHMAGQHPEYTKETAE